MNLLRLTAFLTALMVSGVSGKGTESHQGEVLKHIIELDKQEDKAHFDLQKAEQDALLGKISKAELLKFKKQYDNLKGQLEQELAKLPNRPEIEKWLIDNHVGIGIE